MRWLAVMALWLGLVPMLTAQVARMVREDPSGTGQTEIVVTMSGGANQAFGLGFARFEIQNSTPVAQSVSVKLFSPRYFGGDVSSERNLVVAPGQTRFFLPIAIPPVEYRLEATIGGELFRQRLYYRGGAGVVGLFVSDMSGRESFGTRVLELVPSASLGISPQQVKMQSQDLPTDWRMLTAFSILVVDGDGASGMTGELQEAVRRYAFAGGTVVVSSPRSLPSGALRDLGERALEHVYPHGFGRIVAVPAFGRDQATMELLLAQLWPLGVNLWPANQALFPVQEIAGLGKAPVTVFVLIIVAFAVLVGPLNFLILRRRKKPLLALLTVPALGFGTTIVILAYGILHDGFGVRGVIHSCTLLDQQSHEAVSLNASTLFAGMAPNSMTMAPDTMLMSARAGVDHDDWMDRWSWNADTQRLDGGILPSRTITPLLAVQQGPVRERLTVRRSGDTLELLLDGGIEPVGSVVLCDFEGQYWTGSDGLLRRVSVAAGQRAFAALRAEVRIVSDTEKVPVSPQPLPLMLPTEPQRGSYATRVASAPWLDDHGVSVAYDASSHFVFGTMHAQDFVQ